MDTITIDEAVAIMAAHKYDDDQKAKLRTFHTDGRRVLIFENHDFGHPALGHVIAMSWSAEGDVPPHGPDHPSIGMGWRYVTSYVVEPKPVVVEDLGEV
jgi:hypothetical protein